MFKKWLPPLSDIEKYAHGKIYENDSPTFIKFVVKCWFLQPLSSVMKHNLCELISFSYWYCDGCDGAYILKKHQMT